MAFRIKPMPPSSPAIKIPLILDSKVGVTSGISIPRRALPNTKVIAFSGQEVLQAPCPIQFDGEISSAR